MIAKKFGSQVQILADRRNRDYFQGHFDYFQGHFTHSSMDLPHSGFAVAELAPLDRGFRTWAP